MPGGELKTFRNQLTPSMETLVLWSRMAASLAALLRSSVSVVPALMMRASAVSRRVATTMLSPFARAAVMLARVFLSMSVHALDKDFDLAAAGEAYGPGLLVGYAKGQAAGLSVGDGVQSLGYHRTFDAAS